MIGRYRIRLGFMAMVLSVCLAAFGAMYYLGGYYLRIISEGKPPAGAKVTTGSSRSVIAGPGRDEVVLTPIPVYYLQVGVYSTVEGAREAAAELEKLGYLPYITAAAPHKIWLGIYHERSGPETVKKELRDHGLASFTGSAVLNGGSAGRGQNGQAFIREVMPVMAKHTAWLKENLHLFQSGFEDFDMDLAERQQSVIEKVYRDIMDPADRFKSNNQEIDKGFQDMRTAVECYHTQLLVFMKNRTMEDYALLGYRLLTYIDIYQQLWQKIDTTCKT